MAIENNTCVSENCEYERKQLNILQEAPQKSLDFLSEIISQLSVVEDPNYLK